VIRLRGAIAAEAQILLHFGNGWTASIAPNADGTAVLAAWASHEDDPRFGLMRVAGGGPADANDIAAFLNDISTAPEVNQHVEAI
jgi:hypothetical protein